MLKAFGVRAVAHDVLMPRMRQRLLAVPGRDGSYDFGAGRYEDRVIELECESMRGLTRQELRELAALLARKGRLVLWDEPDKAYVGRLYDDAALRYVGRVGHVFTLRFVCEPFAVGETVVRKVEEDGKMAYEGSARTPVRLAVRNVGAGEVRGVRMIIRRAAP